MNLQCKISMVILSLVLNWPMLGQTNLTIEQIMKGPEFVGHLPSSPFWSTDSKTLYFRWNPEGLPSADLYQWRPGEGVSLVTGEGRRDVPTGPFIYSDDRRTVLYQKHGDIFIQEVSSNEVLRVTNTNAHERNARFSGDEKKIIYNLQNNLYAWNRQTGATEQLTDFRKGKKKKESELPPHKEWLKRDQLEYFKILADRAEDREYREEKSKELRAKRPREIYLGGENLSGNLELSPDGRFVTYTLVKTPAKRQGTQVPDYVTEEGYINELSARPKVGTPNSTYRTFIYDIHSDTQYAVQVDQIPGIYEKPAFLKMYHQSDSTYVDTFPEPREVTILGPTYNRDGSRAVVVVRSHDHKDRWLMELVLTTGELRLVDRQRDEAWIGGPGVGGWGFSTGNLGWINEDEIWFQSEQGGFSHIWTYSFATHKKKALTQGNYEVLDAELSNDKKSFYIHASKEGPFENHFYKLSLADGKMHKVTSEVGKNDVVWSPDETKLAILHSYSNRPTELFVMENTRGAELQKITESTTETFQSYPWRDPEIVFFKARDGEEVPARIYHPKPDKKNGAAVIFVHGAGYLHNVHKWWSSYYREFMFHNFLADQGYTILDIDYRASAGYGRDWRTAIYRHMGGKDLDDQVDGAGYLVAEHEIDPNRLGIYGGSYGGFITLMALCTAPGTFKCGAALRSVTDWAHYNHGYTSNILNTPLEDSIAYYRSSPIYHADKLEGELIMLHGMVDRNVQFQDVVRMSQRFIEAGKDNWELAVFPMEGHGFVEPSSWTDEYKRIYNLFERNLKE